VVLRHIFSNVLPFSDYIYDRTIDHRDLKYIQSNFGAKRQLFSIIPDLLVIYNNKHIF